MADAAPSMQRTRGPCEPMAAPAMLTLRLFRPDPAMVEETTHRLGFALAVAPGRWSEGTTSSLRMGPGEWLIAEARCADVEERLAGALHHCAKMSLAAWRLSAPTAPCLLAMGGTLDFERFEAGDGARTMLAHVPIVVMREPDGCFIVLTDTSHRDYMQKWLTVAGAGLLDTRAGRVRRPRCIF